MSRALFLKADHEEDHNSSNFRILIPAKYLQKAGHEIVIQHVDWHDYANVPDVVLLERRATTERIENLRMAGAKRILVTFDDAYHLLPPASHEYSVQANSYWKNNLADFRQALGMADKVIVPSGVLAADYAKYCRAIEVVPNYYDPELVQESKFVPASTLRIGWGGTLQHRTTWEKSAVLGGLRKFAVDHTGFVVVVCGLNITDLLGETGIPYVYYPWTPFEQWMGVVASFDIGLAPLWGEYDRRRSNLRAVEYGLANVPFVGSLMEPYENCPGGVLVKDEPKFWYDALDWMVKHPVKRSDLAFIGAKWAEGYFMDRNVARYEKLLWGE